MSLKTTPLSQCLDRKLSILGFEVIDIMLIFGCLSILNFVFGSLGMKLALVWTPTLALATVLRLGKRGKPENYILHFLKFKFAPKVLSAFSDSLNFKTPPKVFRKEIV